MKKRLIAFLIATLVAVSALFGGCSCSGEDAISFDTELPKTETLSYNVEYVADYNDSTKKNAELDKYFAFEYSNGTYTSCLKAADKSEIPYKSDILDIKESNGEQFVKSVYSLTTEFKIDLTVKLDGQEQFTHTEKITSIAYFAPFGVSYAPLYAEENAEYTMISLGTETVISVLKSASKTFYDKNEYLTQLTAKSFNANETIDLSGAETKETKTKYAFRSAIDNAEFLFAMRGLKIDEQAYKSINVISSGYETPQPIKITNTALSEKQFTINYTNGENSATVTETIKYASLSFSLDKTNASGKPQYASVQTEAAGSIKDTRLLLEYVKPLIVYGGTIMSMGALVFTLTAIEMV